MNFLYWRKNILGKISPTHNSISVLQTGAIRANLDEMEEFANFLERSLENAVTEIEESIDKHVTQSSADEELWNVTENFPYLFRASALISILGFFEHNLNVVCDALRKEFSKEVKITDLPGKGLKRSKQYISKIIGVNFPANSESWKILLKLSEIRNLIAHRDSHIKNDDPDLLRFINDNQYLSIDFTNRVRLHKGALNYLIDYMHSFFNELSEAIFEFSNKNLLNTELKPD